MSQNLQLSDLAAADIERIYRHTLPSLRTESFYQVIGEQLISKGEPLMAEDVLYHGCKKYEDSKILKFLHARSLIMVCIPKGQDTLVRSSHIVLLLLIFVQAGSVERAIKILGLREDGDSSDETAGLLARAHKDLATRAREEQERKDNLDKAHRIYRKAYEKGGKTSYYLGINAATTALLGGADTVAQHLASEVLQLCLTELKRHDPNSSSRYWVYATIGEAYIIRGNFSQAKEYYQKAVDMVGEDYVKLSSSRRQLFLLLRYAYKGKEIREYEKIFDQLFNLPSVGVLLSADSKNTIATRKGVRRLRHNLQTIVTEKNIKFAFSSLRTTADIIFLEEVLKYDGEIFIVLPIPQEEHLDMLREKFAGETNEEDLPVLSFHQLRRSISKRKENSDKVETLIRRLSGAVEPNFGESFDSSVSSDTCLESDSSPTQNSPLIRAKNLLEEAVRVDVANDLVPESLDINNHYCSLVLSGLAAMRASSLDTSLERLFVSPHKTQENPVFSDCRNSEGSEMTTSGLSLPNVACANQEIKRSRTDGDTDESSDCGLRRRAMSSANDFPPRHDGFQCLSNENHGSLKQLFSPTGSPRQGSSGNILRRTLGLDIIGKSSDEKKNSSSPSVSESYLLSGLKYSHIPSAAQVWVNLDTAFRVLLIECVRTHSFRRTSTGSNFEKHLDKSSGSPTKSSKFLHAPAERPRLIMGILFADVVGYSKLREHEVLSFVENFMGTVAAMIDDLSPWKRPCVKNTWGDAFYFVFFSATDAGEFALSLSDLVSGVRWKSIGLPDNLNIRVSLHAAPVYALTDPITGVRNYTGVHTSRAARIEPITPPGSVYCSQAFAAVSANLPSKFECSYVGNVPLAKAYGMQPVYHVKWLGPELQNSMHRVKKAFNRRNSQRAGMNGVYSSSYDDYSDLTEQ